MKHLTKRSAVAFLWLCTCSLAMAGVVVKINEKGQYGIEDDEGKVVAKYGLFDYIGDFSSKGLALRRQTTRYKGENHCYYNIINNKDGKGLFRGFNLCVCQSFPDGTTQFVALDNEIDINKLDTLNGQVAYLFSLPDYNFRWCNIVTSDGQIVMGPEDFRVLFNKVVDIFNFSCRDIFDNSAGYLTQYFNTIRISYDIMLLSFFCENNVFVVYYNLATKNIIASYSYRLSTYSVRQYAEDIYGESGYYWKGNKFVTTAPTKYDTIMNYFRKTITPYLPNEHKQYKDVHAKLDSLMRYECSPFWSNGYAAVKNGQKMEKRNFLLID